MKQAQLMTQWHHDVEGKLVTLILYCKAHSTNQTGSVRTKNFSEWPKSSSVKRLKALSTPECESICTETGGNTMYLKQQKWFPVQKPSIWDWIHETTPLIPTCVQMGRLGPEFNSWKSVSKCVQESPEITKGDFGVLQLLALKGGV